MKTIHGWSLINLHVLLTSRKELDIEADMTPLLLLPAANRSILRFIVQKSIKILEHILANRLRRNTSGLGPQDQRAGQGGSDGEIRWNVCYNELASQVVSQLDRFQYVPMQLKALKSAKSQSAIQEALANLPTGLDKMYDQALSRIHPDNQEQAIRALNWLAFSIRPLTLSELAEAMAIDPKLSSPFIKDRRLFNLKDVLDFLPGLVAVVEDDIYFERASISGAPDDDSRD
jgi:hypothetical protein